MKPAWGFLCSVALVSLCLACPRSGGELKVEKLEPPQGTVAGGEEITIKGDGFEPGKTQAEVRFGRKKAENVIIASTGKIKVVTPAGSKGPVDVTVAFDDGRQFKIQDGFRYVEPTANDSARKAFFSGGQKPGGIEVEHK